MLMQTAVRTVENAGYRPAAAIALAALERAIAQSRQNAVAQQPMAAALNGAWQVLTRTADRMQNLARVLAKAAIPPVSYCFFSFFQAYSSDS